MPEIAKFVNSAAASITPGHRGKSPAPVAAVEAGIHPDQRAEISRISWTSWNFSPTPSRTRSKAPTRNCPMHAVAQAVFALLYAHKKMGIIPGQHSGTGPRGRFERRARRADSKRKGLRRLRRHAGHQLAENHQPALRLLSRDTDTELHHQSISTAVAGFRSVLKGKPLLSPKHQ